MRDTGGQGIAGALDPEGGDDFIKAHEPNIERFATAGERMEVSASNSLLPRWQLPNCPTGSEPRR